MEFACAYNKAHKSLFTNRLWKNGSLEDRGNVGENNIFGEYQDQELGSNDSVSCAMACCGILPAWV